MSNKNTINSRQIKPIQQKDAAVSDFHINTRTHLQVYKPGQSHKNPSNTFDCHKLAAAWQFCVIGFRKMAHFHKFSNAKIITMKWALPTSTHAQGSNQFESIEKAATKYFKVFMRWACIYIMQISATFGWAWIQLSQHILPCHFICGYILFSKNYPGEPSETREKDEKEVKTLQYGNSVSFSFTFEGSLLASFRLPPTVQHLLLGCPARWFSSVQFSSVQFGSVELAAFCCKQSQRCTGYSRTRSRNRSTVVAEYKRI